MAFLLEAQCEPIPGYRLLEPLGSGGFGEVWKATAPGGLFKAIKIVPKNADLLGGECHIAEQELKALKRIQKLRHPFLLSLDRYDLVEGRLLIVMELADRDLGTCFQQYRSQGLPGIPRDELLRYMLETAEVLDLLNQRHQLQHLDIKPQNLFLVSNHIKVADFGQVQDLGGMASGPLGGVSPPYAAPEVFDNVVCPSSDQYSLAIVYQELLCGQRPFKGPGSLQFTMQHLSAPPDLTPLPEPDRAVVARALAKEAGERYPSCTAFVQALQQAVPASRNRILPAAASGCAPISTLSVRPASTGKRSSKPTKAAEAPVASLPLADQMKAKVRAIQELPMFPEAAQKALKVVQDPRSSIRDFVTIIERDPALATAVLKLANSALYGMRRTTSSLAQAVAWIGLRECMNLILAASTRRLFRTVLATKRWRCELLWRHLLLTAGLARHLNRCLSLGFHGEEFACGVCHDLGRILITLAAPEQCDLADPLDFQETPAILSREQEVLGADHCTLGVWFGAANGLPRPVPQAIQYHHAPAQAGQDRELVALITLADHMANYFHQKDSAEGYDFHDNPGWECLVPSWDEERQRNLAENAVSILATVAQELGKIF